MVLILCKKIELELFLFSLRILYYVRKWIPKIIFDSFIPKQFILNFINKKFQRLGLLYCEIPGSILGLPQLKILNSEYIYSATDQI